jgi:hypothetical protein
MARSLWSYTIRQHRPASLVKPENTPPGRGMVSSSTQAKGKSIATFIRRPNQYGILNPVIAGPDSSSAPRGLTVLTIGSKTQSSSRIWGLSWFEGCSPFWLWL